ncbi:MAG: phosphatidylglycerophosphatase A [Sedimentisphaerales bacterium]
MTIKRLLTSCFGLGWLPAAPGTWGSLPPAIAFAAVLFYSGSVQAVFFVMLGFIIAGGIICIKFSDSAMKITASKDPGEIVADELAGQSLTFAILAMALNTPPPIKQIAVISVIGFVLFRFFDIFKPWPVRQLEKLPAGYGIVSDDIMAGVYAGIVLVIVTKFLILK